ncbi:MAG: hypothetical protein U0412_02875 [Nitrospira sp.]
MTDATARTAAPLSLPSVPLSGDLVFFLATVWEFSAVCAGFPGGRAETCHGLTVYRAPAGPHECWVVQSGVGGVRAASAARTVLAQRRFALAVSSGFACALVPAVVGDILVGTDVTMVSQSGKALSDSLAVAGSDRDAVRVAIEAGESGVPVHRGGFLSVDQVVHRVADKMVLANRVGVVGLDMESAALAQAARDAAVPFLIVRTVSDLVTEELPLDFNLFLRPTGWLKGIGFVLTHPACLVGIARLGRQSRIAAKTLTACLLRVSRAAVPIGVDGPETKAV